MATTNDGAQLAARGVPPCRDDALLEFDDEDWILFDDAGEPLARIYHYRFGSHAGCWSWIVLIATDGTLFGADSGVAKTAHEAREECERRVPADMMMARQVGSPLKGKGPQV